MYLVIDVFDYRQNTLIFVIQLSLIKSNEDNINLRILSIVSSLRIGVLKFEFDVLFFLYKFKLCIVHSNSQGCPCFMKRSFPIGLQDY